ncbi:MAG: hypothetical protein ACP5EQ_06700 [Candidatus Cloacimonadia bacterium]
MLETVNIPICIIGTAFEELYAEKILQKVFFCILLSHKEIFIEPLTVVTQIDDSMRLKRLNSRDKAQLLLDRECEKAPVQQEGYCYLAILYLLKIDHYCRRVFLFLSTEYTGSDYILFARKRIRNLKLTKKEFFNYKEVLLAFNSTDVVFKSIKSPLWDDSS